MSVKRSSPEERRVPTVVTFLEMKAKSSVVAPTPKGKIAILRAEKPPVHFYRYLYNTIGDQYCWVDRRKVDDKALEAILRDPLVELYILNVDGCPAGMAELDFRKKNIANLAYFGLMPEFLGRGLGFFFLHQAVQLAWSKPIEKFLVNTCTLDHPRALPLYQRLGFVPYAREDRYIEIP